VPEAAWPQWPVAVAAAALAAAVLGAGLLVDPAADAAFDAPKRLAVRCGIVLAAAALFVVPAPRWLLWRIWRQGPPLRRWLLGLGALAAVCICVSALLSPRPALALEGLRGVGLYALLVPLGASRLLAGGARSFLLAVFLGTCAVNATLSLLQGLDLYRLVGSAAVSGRLDTGALVGNEGQLALVLVLGALLALGIGLRTPRRALRAAAGGVLLLCLAGILTNLNLTALAALLAGISVLLGALLGRRALAPAVVVLLGAALAVAVYPPFRERIEKIAGHARAGEWNDVLTNRLGPWAAALEMARERPLAGWGPGTFGAEYVPHRLQAELRFGERLLIPKLSSSFAEAHCDYLQALAELGLPGALLLSCSLAVLLSGLLTVARSGPSEAKAEATLLLAVLGSGAVAALTWFPLQQPSFAVPYLLAAGRAASLLGPVPRGQPAGRGARALLTLTLLAAVAPELPRYGAERRLGQAQAAIRLAMAAPEGPHRQQTLGRAAESALAAAAALVGDSRPWSAAGAARLAAREPQRALELYGSALERGERAEIVLNLGRAHAMLDRRPEALAGFVRAAWINPLLIPSMPVAAQPLVQQELARLETLLRGRQLAAPPPLPPLAAE
jgi:O-antigen ligase